MKKSLKLVLMVSGVWALATLSPAPINGFNQGLTPHHNLQAQDEKTLESEQGVKVMGEVGKVESHAEDTQISGTDSSGQAAAVLAQAQRVGAHPTADSGQDAKQVLAAAENRIEAKHTFPWLLLGLVLAGIAGCLFGAKRWADNNIPEMPVVKTKSTNW